MISRRPPSIATGFALALAAASWQGCSCGDATGVTGTSAGSISSASSSSSGTVLGTTSGSGSGSGTSGSPSCGLNAELCGGKCVVTLSDPNNCGGCGVVCNASEVCAVGVCGPPSSCPYCLSACGQTCVNELSDDNNCGGCGQTCPSGQGCSTGLCVTTVGLTGQTPTCPSGAPTVISDAGVSSCTGSLAQNSFRWALCSCDTITAGGSVATDGFDSSVGPDVDGGGLGGGVGANDTITVSGIFEVGGSLWTDSDAGLTEIGLTGVGIELHDNGPLNADEVGSIGSNAYVNGSVTAFGSLGIDGGLYVPTGASVSPFVQSRGVIEGPVTVPPPCDCAPSQVPDIAGIVAYGSTHNDNNIVGLYPDVFKTSTGALRLDLPCGQYYLSELVTFGIDTIAIHGPVVLFVGGDVDPTGGLQISVDPQATLDMFVGGNLNVTGLTDFGSPLVPAQTRVYIAGTQVNFDGDLITAGNFYAPNAQVSPAGTLTLYGSLFAGNYQTFGATDVHYDGAILNAGATCTDGGVAASCNACTDCGGLACVNGSCGPCTSDSQCCAPLLCAANGKCLQQFE